MYQGAVFLILNLLLKAFGDAERHLKIPALCFLAVSLTLINFGLSRKGKLLL